MAIIKTSVRKPLLISLYRLLFRLSVATGTLLLRASAPSVPTRAIVPASEITTFRSWLGRCLGVIRRSGSPGGLVSDRLNLVLVTVLVLVFLRLVEPCDAVITDGRDELRADRFRFALQRLRLLAITVHHYDLRDLRSGHRIEIRERALLVSEIHYLLKDVSLGQIGQAILEFKRFRNLRNTGLGVQIVGDLIIQAAFQFAALTSQLLRIQGQVLRTGRRSGNS